MQSIEHQLHSIGLSKNESQVYVVLCTLGLCKAGDVVKKTKLHRMLVYTALDQLVDRGLATRSKNTGGAVFQAADPKALRGYIERMSEMTESVIDRLHDIQQIDSKSITVRTLVGREGFILNLQEIISSAHKQKDRTMRIIGGARDTDVYAVIGEWYSEYTRLLERSKVSKKLLAPTSYSNEFKKKFVSEKNTELRTMTKGLSAPTYTRITEEMVSIEIYEPSLMDSNSKLSCCSRIH
jgi:sugar-specific transcriptional regulator TrmB